MESYKHQDTIDDYKDVLLEDPNNASRTMPLSEAMEQCPPLRITLENAQKMGQLGLVIDTLKAEQIS